MKFITIFDPKNEINFIKMFKPAGMIAFGIVFVSIVSLFSLGINFGLDFVGGMELQAKFKEKVEVAKIRNLLEEIGFDKTQIQDFGPSANNELLIRVERASMLNDSEIVKLRALLQSNFENILPDNKENVLIFDEKMGNQAYILLKADSLESKEESLARIDKLFDVLANKAKLDLRKTKVGLEEEESIKDAIKAGENQNGIIKYTVHFAGVSHLIQTHLAKNFGEVEIRKVDFVDSQITRQLRTDGVLALIYALIAIVIYIAIRFDFFFSPGAIIALIHDTMGAMLVFVFGRIEFDTPSIAALLTIVGYSINNTIVIYDRIRETVPTNPKKPLSVNDIKPYVNKAINDTLSRSINTTLTTMFASIAIWIVATGVIERFAIVLTFGLGFGLFSSLFVAPAIYLLSRKYLKTAETNEAISTGPTREEKAKGVV